MKKLLAAALALLLSSTGYVIVDHTIETRVETLESQVQSLEDELGYERGESYYNAGDSVNVSDNQKYSFPITNVNYYGNDTDDEFNLVISDISFIVCDKAGTKSTTRNAAKAVTLPNLKKDTNNSTATAISRTSTTTKPTTYTTKPTTKSTIKSTTTIIKPTILTTKLTTTIKRTSHLNYERENNTTAPFNGKYFLVKATVKGSLPERYAGYKITFDDMAEGYKMSDTTAVVNNDGTFTYEGYFACPTRNGETKLSIFNPTISK